MIDFDPTTNRIPFGLLSEDERKALEDWPHGWEIYFLHNECWNPSPPYPNWHPDTVYRGKPAPVVTSAWWNIDSNGGRTSCYYSRKDVNANASSCRISVLRIDTCNGVSTAHLEEI